MAGEATGLTIFAMRSVFEELSGIQTGWTSIGPLEKSGRWMDCSCFSER